MLRHYDALGLLVPAYVDPVTGYRHYTTQQFHRVDRLLALKDLGFTLDQVRPILDAEVGADELRGMLLLRQSQITAQIGADTGRLARIATRLRIIERKSTMEEAEFVRWPSCRPSTGLSPWCTWGRWTPSVSPGRPWPARSRLRDYARSASAARCTSRCRPTTRTPG